MTHPMLEKVARGIAQLQWPDPDALASKCYGKQITVTDAPIWKSYMREARAAIEAMREPTVSMVCMGSQASTDEASIWRAMIDHILKGEG